MTVTLMIKKRLRELGLEQRDLAEAAEVTESYISQLLTGRRSLPAPGRTDIYPRMEELLELPHGRLSGMVEDERRANLIKMIGTEPVPLYPEVREMLLRTCRPVRRSALKTLFERLPFGELERLITQTMLDLLKQTIREKMEDEDWLDTVLAPHGLSPEEMRSMALRFLDSDILHLPQETCSAFLESLVDSWDIDLPSFEMKIVLHPVAGTPSTRVFQFVERAPGDQQTEEPGLREFLRDPALSGTATEEEIEFLRGIKVTTGRPTALYYYRELQNIRDPLHIVPPPAED